MTFLNFYCGVFLVHVHILNVYHLAIVWFSIVQEELDTCHGLLGNVWISIAIEEYEHILGSYIFPT